MAVNTMAVQTLVIMMFVLIAGGICAVISTGTDEGEQITAFEQSSDEPPTQFGRDILKAHNKYRRKHKTRRLVWSTEAAQMAQEWADELVKAKTLSHGNHKGMGQNIAAATGSSPLTGSRATKMWYNEIKRYDFSNQSGKRQPGTGHFTQVVWKGTKGLGCGIAVSGRKSYVVCNYTPPGNVQGRYRENVKPPKP